MQKSLIALFLLASSAAFAGDVAPAQFQSPSAGERSRAEVKAELQQARAAGALSAGEIAAQPRAQAAGRSRGEVRAEALQAARSAPHAAF